MPNFVIARAIPNSAPTSASKHQVPSPKSRAAPRDLRSEAQRIQSYASGDKKSLICTSIKTRALALIAATFVTFATVYIVAEYALPEATAVQLAAAAR